MRHFNETHAMNVERLGFILQLLDPDSLMWLAVVQYRRDFLIERSRHHPDLRWILLSEPKSVIDLTI